MSTHPRPAGYHSITPYLLVPGVDAVVAFLEEAFDADVVQCLRRADGSVMHVEARIGDSMVMLGEPMGEFGPMPGSIYLYVDDCDHIFERALRAGGVSVMAPTTMSHAGQRYGGIKDPSGNLWWIATHIEDVDPAEQARRATELGI